MIPCIYDDARDFSEGLAIVKKEEISFFIDKNGNKVFECEYEGINSDGIANFSDGLAKITKPNGNNTFLAGFIDRTGNVVIPCIYEETWVSFSEGLAVVKKDGKYGFVDKQGKSTFDYYK